MAGAEHDWLTPAQVADLLQLSVSAVRLMLRDGRLRGRRVRGSRLIRIARADAEGLLEPITPREAASGRIGLRLAT